MLQIKVLQTVRLDPGDREKVVSCQIFFNGAVANFSMWESEYKVLAAAKLFGRGHRPTKEGISNESPVFTSAVNGRTHDPIEFGDAVENSFADCLD